MLKIQDLTAGYGAVPVVQNLSLEVAAGELAAIIGPNGCGKSTALRCAAGLLVPQTGTITIDGQAVGEAPARERARLVALLPQTFEGGETLTVEQMVMLGRTPYLMPYGAPTRHDKEVVETALWAVNGLSLRARRVGSLSGGERQRVMLARALAQQPRVLLLDEPTSHLDIRYQYEILALTRRLARQERLAVVVVLHQINLAAAAADKLVLLNTEGRLQAAGKIEQVMTAEHLQAVYDIPLHITAHPRSGRPQAQSVWVFEDEIVAENASGTRIT